MSDWGNDLFGAPIPENYGGKGRPAHVPNDENRNKIRLLLACGWDQESIAKAIDLSVPTMKEHYFSILQERARYRLQVKAKLVVKIAEQASKGVIGAIDRLERLLEEAGARGISARDLVSGQSSEEAPSRAKGKKELADDAARETLDGTRWDGILPN